MNTPIDIKPILNDQGSSYEITSDPLSDRSSMQKVTYQKYTFSEEQNNSQHTQTHYSNLKYPSPEPLDGKF